MARNKATVATKSQSASKAQAPGSDIPNSESDEKDIADIAAQFSGDPSDTDDVLIESSEEDDVSDFGSDDYSELLGDVFDDSGVASVEELGLVDPNGNPNAGVVAHGLPRTLKAPPPRPGYRQRFVRYMINGRKDSDNIARSKFKGWIPRKASTIKGKGAYSIEPVGNDGILMIRGHVLCEMPEQRAKLHRESVNRLTERNAQAVRADYERDGDDSYAPTEFKENLTVRRGKRKPTLAPDRK